jgi:superfamily II DNA/RNA helicase
LATAPTGSGKTVAFGLPLIQNLNHVKNKLQAIILAPFFELS